MFRRSSIDKIVGKATEEEKLDILGQTDEQFNDQKFEQLVGRERAKTPEELEMISLANDVTNAALRYYGLPEFVVPPENVHVVSAEAYAEIFDEEVNEDGASFHLDTQNVLITEQKTSIAFFRKMVHEVFHFKSFQAVQITEEDEHLAPYRSGLTANNRKGGGRYLERLDEALNEEMTIRGVLHALDDPRLAAEVARVRTVVDPELEQSDEAMRDFFSRFFNVEHKPNKEDGFSLDGYTYPREREALNLLIDKLHARNPGKFKDELEVFDLFARTKLAGSLLPVGRLIDETFGKETFRKLGETETDQDFYAAVAAL